jgi:hypothetical protein
MSSDCPGLPAMCQASCHAVTDNDRICQHINVRQSLTSIKGPRQHCCNRVFSACCRQLFLPCNTKLLLTPATLPQHLAMFCGASPPRNGSIGIGTQPRAVRLIQAAQNVPALLIEHIASAPPTSLSNWRAGQALACGDAAVTVCELLPLATFPLTACTCDIKHTSGGSRMAMELRQNAASVKLFGLLQRQQQEAQVYGRAGCLGHLSSQCFLASLFRDFRATVRGLRRRGW